MQTTRKPETGKKNRTYPDKPQEKEFENARKDFPPAEPSYAPTQGEPAKPGYDQGKPAEDNFGYDETESVRGGKAEEFDDDDEDTDVSEAFDKNSGCCDPGADKQASGKR